MCAAMIVHGLPHHTPLVVLGHHVIHNVTKFQFLLTKNTHRENILKEQYCHLYILTILCCFRKCGENVMENVPLP